MDFEDSVSHSIEFADRKSQRMQSWYLYEQYRSLEKNQIDATQTLRDRSYQGMLLQKELNERRERRRICEECSMYDKNRFRSIDDVRSCITSSDNDFFESFCEMHDDVELVLQDCSPDADAVSCRDSQQTVDSRDVADYDNEYKQDFPDDFDELKGESSRSVSPVSDVTKRKSDVSLAYHAVLSNANLADDIKEELEQVKREIAENINKQRETVKETLECCKELSKFNEETRFEAASPTICDEKSDKYLEVYDDESLSSLQLCDATDDDDDDEPMDNAFSLWSKIVAFAYQMIQHSHGNCYYDYSSQFLTAVLAFDVLRRGVNKMCQLLQPYVSPINYIDESQCSKKYCKSSKEFPPTVQSTTKCLGCKAQCKHNSRNGVKKAKSSTEPSATCCTRRTCTYKNKWRRNGSENRCKCYEVFGESESWQSGTHPSTIWPPELGSRHSSGFASCRSRSHVHNPMTKVAAHIDSVLQHITSRQTTR